VSTRWRQDPLVRAQALAERHAAKPGGGVGTIRSWDISTGVDGPGTRFVVFTNGCPLRCLYCSNPETWRMQDGTHTTVDELMTEISRYRRFISIAGGGVTVTGGEPLLQPAFTGELLHRCHELGLHTALDTSGFLGDQASDALLADTDLVLLDIKSGDAGLYRDLTGGEIEPTRRFARRLARLERRVWVRFVLVPGVTDAEDNVEGIASFVAGLPNVEYVDVLAFHRLGVPKYQELGLRFPLTGIEPPRPELLTRVHTQFRSHGLMTR
jgi:pyruvate formate lyase activating enzyme